MNTALAASREATVPATRARRRVPAAGAEITLRSANAADAPAIHALIAGHLEEGRLLPRSLDELSRHAARFLVAERRHPHRAPAIVGCAELAPLSREVAEIRSLVVDRSARAMGIGRRLIDALRANAVRSGFDRLCAFTHDAAYFVRKGFAVVPHHWIAEKIAVDCSACALFGRCGQHAVLLPLRG